ncbi:hypothetical protein [Marinobacter sp. F4218]|uniref:hypothetical protein n=1 Tax=Marinobacter sp. F4218 TaxID=2862868 RepID=UPI001C63A39B|nr:hypothetical protein [Marinobacter sp. F4218]MBW7470444.1 hypothetical protein [Marinobacter sp. F4218]
MFVLIGKIPPPLGGVSIYCKRRLEQLKKTEKRVRFLDVRRITTPVILLWMFLKARIEGEDFIIELNTSHFLIYLFFVCFGLSKYTVFFDHNSTRRINLKSFEMFFFREFIKRSLAVHLVSEDLKRFYIQQNIFFKEKSHVVCPFLPPNKNEIELAKRTVPESLKGLLKKQGKRIVLASAHSPKNSSKEPDLYGIFDTLKIYKKLLPKYKDLDFLMLIGRLDDSSFSQEILDISQELSVANSNFYFEYGGVEQSAFLSNLILLVRLTKTDGDSLSVREALLSGAHVVASDVCFRPEGVNTVPLGDVDKTVKLISKLLSDKKVL